MDTGNEQMPLADGAPPGVADDVAELRREWSEVTSLSESDRATLEASAHLAELRATKDKGGPAQVEAEKAMLGMYEVSALFESELAPALLEALESTLGGIQKIRINTPHHVRITMDTALGELVMKRVFKEYALDHIGDISDENSRETLLRREIPTDLVDNKLAEKGCGAMYALIGNYREQLEGVEEDLDMPDVDPHVVSVIAGIEERALAVMERRYANPVEGAWVTWVTDRMLMRIKQTRAKLQALIAQMEARYLGDKEEKEFG